MIGREPAPGGSRRGVVAAYGGKKGGASCAPWRRAASLKRVSKRRLFTFCSYISATLTGQNWTDGMQRKNPPNIHKFIDVLARVSCPLVLVGASITRHLRIRHGAMIARTTAKPTPVIRVSKDGSLSSDIGPGSFGGGFSQLLNLTAPTFTPKPLAPQETTRLGFVRTGEALSEALAKARERFKT